MPRARDAKHELTIEYERGWFTAGCSCGKWSDQERDAATLAVDWTGHMAKVGKVKVEVAPPTSTIGRPVELPDAASA